MPSMAGTSISTPPAPPGALPTTRTAPGRLPGRQATGPFSVILLGDPESATAAQLQIAMTAIGATDIRYATSPADLLRGIPRPADTGVGVICRSPRADAVVQLVSAMRQRGWRRVVIACHDGDEAAIRLAFAAKIRCLIKRQDDVAVTGWSDGAASLQAAARELSPREVQVLQAVADGHTNNEVGALLGLSGLTVKSHLARIGRKTGTGDRAEMVAVAMRAGLVV